MLKAIKGLDLVCVLLFGLLLGLDNDYFTIPYDKQLVEEVLLIQTLSYRFMLYFTCV